MVFLVFIEARMLFLDVLVDAVEFLIEPSFNFAAGDTMLGYFDQSTDIAIPQIQTIVDLLSANNDLLRQIHNELTNIGEIVQDAIEETELASKYSSIRARYKDLKDILDTFNQGGYKNNKEFRRALEELAIRIKNELTDTLSWLDIDWMGKSYLKRRKEAMIEDQTDLLTYVVNLSILVKDMAFHYEQAIELFYFASYEFPHLRERAEELEASLKQLRDFQQDHLQGTWRPVVLHWLKKGDDQFFNNKTFSYYNSSRYMFALPESPFYVGIGEGPFTPFIFAPTQDSIDVIGNGTIRNITFNIYYNSPEGRKTLGLGNEVPLAQFTEIEPNSDVWQIFPCNNTNINSTATLDFVCIKNLLHPEFLTLENKPHGETESEEASPYGGRFIRKAFAVDSPYQVFSMGEVQRCCYLYERTDFEGKSAKLCLNLTESFKEFGKNPEGLTSIASGVCFAQVQLSLFNGTQASGSKFQILEGERFSTLPSNEIGTVLSGKIESSCSRISIFEQSEEDYVSICSNMKDLGDKFVDQNVSIMIAEKILDEGKVLIVYEAIDFSGNRTIIRESISNLENWPYPIRSVKIALQQEAEEELSANDL